MIVTAYFENPAYTQTKSFADAKGESTYNYLRIRDDEIKFVAHDDNGFPRGHIKFSRRDLKKFSAWI